MDLPSSSTRHPAEILQKTFPVEPKASTERADMVEAARQFFTNPRVKGTPVEEQKKYLQEKGLTEAEIQQAIDAAAVGNRMNESAAQRSSDSPTREGGGGIFSALQSAVVVGGASYMAYKLMRSWVLPKFFDIPDPAREQNEALQAQISDLQKSVKLMMDGVAQTLEAVSAQQEQLNRALMLMSNNGVNRGNDLDKLQSDIGIVKSLLLNQNQFPPIPEFPTTKMANKINGTANGDVKKIEIKASQNCLNGSGSNNCSEDDNDDV